MQRNTASLHSQPPSTAPTPKPALSPFQAKRIKRKLIDAYCRELIPAEAVEKMFAVFKELLAA
jgi:hypothetical protein